MVTLVIKKEKVLLDDADYQQLLAEFGNKMTVELRKVGDKYYATTRRTVNGSRETITISRYLMGILEDKDKLVRFHNRNPLDMTRRNMAVCTRDEVMQGRRASANSTSKYVGVSWSAARNKWRAAIKPSPSDNVEYLGLFDSEEDAADAYNLKAKEYHGEFANLNVIKRDTKRIKS